MKVLKVIQTFEGFTNLTKEYLRWNAVCDESCTHGAEQCHQLKIFGFEKNEKIYVFCGED